MLALLLLFAALPPVAAPVATSGDAYYEVRLGELVEDLPGEGWRAPWNAFFQWPYVVLDDGGEAWFRPAGWDERQADPAWRLPMDLPNGTLVLRVPEGASPSGRVFVPREGETSWVAHPFTLSPEAATGTREAFLRARLAWTAHLLDQRVPGSAWFRHRLDADRRELGLEPGTTDPALDTRTTDLSRTLSLFVGGRAISENLQLDRLLPIVDAEIGTVPLDDIEGIDVRPFDWEPLLEESLPELDALAACIPADQHAVFFESFGALTAFHEELDTARDVTAFLDERGVTPAAVRDRYLEQLALPWNALVRAFGERAIRGVAITGSDPYLPTGSDVALLFETDQADALLDLLEGLRTAAVPEDVRAVVSGEASGFAWTGVESPGRAVSSLGADLGGVVVVANSRRALEAVAAATAGERPRMGELDEYRFFRQRYRRGGSDGASRALVVVPDDAIRRWCGPRWRIAASRRVRARAVLLDLQARHLEAIVERRQVRLAPDARFPLGGLQLLEHGVHSSEYGSIRFQTPIAELDFDRVGPGEAELYRRWREGYQRNWSTVFDPIGVELSLSDDGVELDVTVLPLIDSTEYRDVRDVVGEARLEAGDGDPHPGTLLHLTMGLDKEAPSIAELSAMSEMLLPGVDPIGWLGDHLSIWVDDDPDLEELFAADRLGFEERLSKVPLVVLVDVSDGLGLAAFLTALRGLVESSAPGLVRWQPDSEGEDHFVRISSEGMGEGLAIYYATPPGAFLLSLHRGALVQALVRARNPEEGPRASWAGASAGLEVSARGLAVLDVVDDSTLGSELQQRAFAMLPILNEWRHRFPDRDPIAFHGSFWGEPIDVPGGGSFRWNEEDGTMESSVFGSPTRPAAPGSWRDEVPFERYALSLAFEHDGIRARVRALRRASGERDSDGR